MEAAATAEASVWDEMENQNAGYIKTMKENGMQVLAPSEELLSGLTAIGEQMTSEWIEAAGDAGAAVIEAYRAA